MTAEHDASLVVARAHHIEQVAPARLLPVIDAPVHAEHPMYHICHALLVILLRERTGRGVPAHQILPRFIWNRHHFELQFPNTAVAVRIFHAGLARALEPEAWAWLSINANDSCKAMVFTSVEHQELQRTLDGVRELSAVIKIAAVESVWQFLRYQHKISVNILQNIAIVVGKKVVIK